MSTDLDFFGLIFDGVFEAQAQNREKNGGPTFQVVDGIAPGTATIAEAALNAIHPGVAIGSALGADFIKTLVPAKLTLQNTQTQEFAQKATRKTEEYRRADKNTFEQLYQQILSAKVNDYFTRHGRNPTSDELVKLKEEARKEAETFAGVQLGVYPEPKLDIKISDLSGFFFNPKGTIDKIVAKSFSKQPNKKWKVLMAGSSAVAAGFAIRQMTQNPHIDTKGDAVMIAAAEPAKRAHVFAGGKMLGTAISDEKKIKMVFDNALDMVARAETASTGAGNTMVIDPNKRVVARYGAEAIVEYAKQNKLHIDDVINNWGAHSANVQSFMQDPRFAKKFVKRGDRQAFQAAFSAPGAFDFVEQAWINPNTNISLDPTSNFNGTELLKDYFEYRTNRQQWLGRTVTGVHAYHYKLDQLIDNSVRLYAQAAEDKGDTEKANTYRTMLIENKMGVKSLSRMEKLYWYKLKWDTYKEVLGPSAGFGLITGDFFTAVAGAAVVENNLIPKVNVLQTSVLEHMRGVSNLDPEFVDLFTNGLNLRRDNLPDFLSSHAQLSGFAAQLSGFSQGLLQSAGFSAVEINKTFGLYKGIPLIPKNANKMQRMSYIVGTLHPYQLVRAFLDGSLGDRFMYIGLRFGNLRDFNDLKKYEKFFLKLGLKLNNSVLYNRFRRIAMATKFVTNTPTIIIQAGFKKYKTVVKKAAVKIRNWVVRKMRAAAARLAASRFARMAVTQFIKRGIEAVADFLTAGAAELFFRIYDALNFLTGGLLDKVVFKSFLYTMWFVAGTFLLVIFGFSTLMGGVGKMFSSATTNVPSSSQVYVYSGYGRDDIDGSLLAKQAQSGAASAGFSSILAGSAVVGGVNALSAVGHSLGHSACVVKGCISQMWTNAPPEASSYHQNHQAIDIAGNEHMTVYALISGEATCLSGKSDVRIKCRDGSYAGDAVLIKGENGVSVYNLHLRCAFSGSWHVEAGDGIGIVASHADGLQSGDCWSGPHLHIHLDPKDGPGLFCTLQEKCGTYPYCNVWGKADVTCN